jgi:CTP:molybdopterin cytidylyltransferase MocA
VIVAAAWEAGLVNCAGLLLAAGGGSRMGVPKALVDDPFGGSFVERGVRVLRAGGCAPVVVVVGAEAQRAAALASSAGAEQVIEAPDWAQGQSASLTAGLQALQSTEAEAACILLVDLPDVGAAVLERVVTASAAAGRAALVRAAYQGVPGHPVVMGRDHWQGVLDTATGDRGARDYLAAHEHVLVECGDLASGRDVDTPDDL